MDVRFPTAEDLDVLLARGPRVVRTVAGPVEYAEAGEGPALLSVHGSGGGWGYALGMAGVFASNGFRVIAPSRPGYFGTPLATGRTYEEQADALAALLDVLGIDRLAALGFSGGGPPTYLLAARHPQRVSCLVEVAAMSTTFGYAGNPLLMGMLFSRPGMELFAGLLRAAVRVRPVAGAQLLMSDETTQDRGEVAALAKRVMADPSRAAFVTQVWIGSARNVGRWLPGQRNDNAQLAALTPLDLTGIGCPTLIVQGTADAGAAPHSAYAAEQIPGAQLLTIPEGGHRAFWVADDAAEHQAFVLAWLREHT